MARPGPSQEARERAELGGYTHAELDAAIVRAERSDPLTLSLRLGALLVVYGLLARAIAIEHPPLSLLWLPLAAEFVAMMLIGLLLSRFVVDDPRFRRSVGSVGLIVFWLLVIGGAYVIAWSHRPGEGVELARFLPTARQNLATLRRIGLHWAVIAAFGFLVVGTVVEVLRWRSSRAAAPAGAPPVFVWTAILGLGFRIAAMFLLGFLAVFLVAFLGGVVGAFVPGVAEGDYTWVVFAFLLLGELAAVVLGAAMHRDLSSRGATTAAVTRRSRSST